MTQCNAEEFSVLHDIALRHRDAFSFFFITVFSDDYVLYSRRSIPECVTHFSLPRVGKPVGKRPLGRPRRRWEDNVKMDVKEVGGGRGDWMELAQDRDRWRALRMKSLVVRA
jgi:hypothetical protein